MIDSLESRILFAAVFGVSQISALPKHASEYGPEELTAFGNDVLFDATDPATGRQAIWKSDGTRSEPLSIAIPGDDLLVGVVGSEIFFAATSKLQPSTNAFIEPSFVPPEAELYETGDLGRSSVDLGPAPGGAGYGDSAGVGGSLYFTTGPSYVSSQLWVCNGTTAGTHQFLPPSTTPYTGELNLQAPQLLAFNNEVLVEGYNGSGLVVFDPTTQTAQNISNLAMSVTIFENQIYFSAPDPNAPSNANQTYETYTLWASDGTAGGTRNLYAGAANYSSLPSVYGITYLSPDELLLSVVSDLGAGTGENLAFNGSLNFVTLTGILPSIQSSIQFDGTTVVTSGGSEVWNIDGSGGSREVLNVAPKQIGTWVATGSTLFETDGDDWNVKSRLGYGVHLGPGQLYAFARVGAPPAFLTATIVKSTLSDGVANSRVAASITVQISNTGDQTSHGRSTLELDLSQDGVTKAAELRAISFARAIKPGASILIKVPIHHMPVVPAGSYSVIAQLSGPGGQYNEASSVITVAVSPAILLSNVTLRTTGPGYFDTGHISFSVKDISSSFFSNTDYVEVFLADSGTTSIIGSSVLDSSSEHIQVARGQTVREPARLDSDPSSDPFADIMAGDVLIIQVDDDLGVLGQASIVVTAADLTPVVAK